MDAVADTVGGEVAAKLDAGRTGNWKLKLNAPSRAFQYYAVSSNGQRSRIASLTV